MQVHEGKIGESKTGANRGFYFPSLRIIGGVLRHEGIGGLYQGLSPAVTGSAISWGGFFFVYESMKKFLRNKKGKGDDVPLSSIENFQLACASGAVMVFLTNPIWLIKLRMQLQMKKTSERMKGVQKPYKGLLHAASTIIKEEGYLGLYKGAGAALLLTSHGGIQFVVYEALRKNYHYSRAQRDENGNDSPVLERLEKSVGYLSMGSIAKVVAGTTTYPLQVVKARMQQRSEMVEVTSDGNIRMVRRDYVGITETIRRIWLKEGASGFFKGCVPNVLRVAPSAGITFVTYESVIDFLKA
jgi:solute carrier family 25 folate transporter 32